MGTRFCPGQDLEAILSEVIKKVSKVVAERVFDRADLQRVRGPNKFGLIH